jgi:hypothetical protein
MGETRKDIILFTHIGKTGGMSLNKILNSRFSPHEVIGDGNRDFFYSVIYIAYGFVRCISGHFGYGLHSLLPRTLRPRYVTMLRDPFERLRSLYNYRPEALEQGTFEQFIMSQDRQRNMMTKYLCGFAYEPSVALAVKRLCFDYGCFGILEHFNESIDWICETLALGESNYPQVNIAPDKLSIETDELQRLRSLMEVEDADDFALYRAANRIFEARRRGADPLEFPDIAAKISDASGNERDRLLPLSLVETDLLNRS